MSKKQLSLLIISTLLLSSIIHYNNILTNKQLKPTQFKNKNQQLNFLSTFKYKNKTLAYMPNITSSQNFIRRPREIYFSSIEKQHDGYVVKLKTHNLKTKETKTLISIPTHDIYTQLPYLKDYGKEIYLFYPYTVFKINPATHETTELKFSANPIQFPQICKILDKQYIIPAPYNRDGIGIKETLYSIENNTITPIITFSTTPQPNTYKYINYKLGMPTKIYISEFDIQDDYDPDLYREKTPTLKNILLFDIKNPDNIETIIPNDKMPKNIHDIEYSIDKPKTPNRYNMQNKNTKYTYTFTLYGDNVTYKYNIDTDTLKKVPNPTPEPTTPTQTQSANTRYNTFSNTLKSLSIQCAPQYIIDSPQRLYPTSANLSSLKLNEKYTLTTPLTQNTFLAQ